MNGIWTFLKENSSHLCSEYLNVATFLDFFLYPSLRLTPWSGDLTYEGRLISNAHSEISRKRDHVFKQMNVGSKVQYFSYKLTYLFLDIVALSFNTFFPTLNTFTHAVNEEFRSSLFDPRRHSFFTSSSEVKWVALRSLLRWGKKWKSLGTKSGL